LVLPLFACMVGCALAVHPDAETSHLEPASGLIFEFNGDSGITRYSVKADSGSDDGELGEDDRDAESDKAARPLIPAADSARRVQHTAHRLKKRIDTVLEGMKQIKNGVGYELNDDLEHLHQLTTESDFHQDIEDAMLKARHTKQLINGGAFKHLPPADVERAQKSHRQSDLKPQQLSSATDEIIIAQLSATTGTQKLRKALQKAYEIGQMHKEDLGDLMAGRNGLTPWQEEQEGALETARDLLAGIVRQESQAATSGEDVPPLD